MNIQENYSLKNLNTFGIDVSAASYVEVSSTQELIEVLKLPSANNHMILGGGSNILFTKNFDGLMIKNSIRAIDVVSENDSEVVVKVGAGEVWHDFVLHCIDQGWGGIENMSLIPGVVGAAPIQNIGAYGVEQKDLFVELEALRKSDQEVLTLNAEDCQFGYRDSLFKNEGKGEYVILNVTYRLNKNNTDINTSYGAIKDVLNSKGIEQPSIKDVSDAVIEIRQSKLPDPAKIGNGGSFFKNPVVPTSVVENIKKEYPEIPTYPIDDQQTKVPAGWLIEKAGFKGQRFGEVGVHERQALVLVNYGNGKGQEIFDLSEKILITVNQQFGIKLEREVNII